MLFTGDSNKFTVSRYTIGQYKILFTNMDHVQAYEFIKNKRTADEGS